MSNKNPVYQTQKHPSLKDSYVFASTSAMVDTMASKGWTAVSSSATRVRNKERDGFQKHIVRFENPLFPSIPGLSSNNASKPQIVAINSHDGTTATRLMLGLFRMVCTNGLIAGTSLREFRAVHSGNLAEKLGEGTDFIADGVPEMIKQVQMLQQTKFTPEALEQLTKTLVDERLKFVQPVSVDYESALAIRRFEDKETDAFTVFNRLQEALIRGGISFVSERNILDKDGNVVGTELRNGTTRRMYSIAQAVKLNRMAYDLAVKLAA